MKVLLSSLICGFLFGLGLIVSGMSNPARVLNFLDWSASWDPTLGFVMGGAIVVTMPCFYWIRKRDKPLFTAKLDLPNKQSIDTKLIIGSSIFGIGWGIGGFCPGPSIVALVTMQKDVLLFFIAMLIGMLAQHWLDAKGSSTDG